MRNSLLGILGLFLMLTACEKPESKIGLELLPSEENLGFVEDSSTVVLHQVYHDSLITNGLRSALLGDFYDPAFGNTKANIFTQIRLSNPNVDFGELAEIDSVVLTLAYYEEGFYGNLDDFEISVMRITDTLQLDSSYYSYQSFAVDEIELVDSGSSLITPEPTEEVVIDGDTLDPHMRIKLRNDWGSEFLLNTDITNLESNDNFLEYFHGLRITAVTPSGEGGIVYTDLVSDLSSLTLYYNLGAEDDSLSYEFLISSSSQQVVQFEHDYLPSIVSSIDDGMAETEEIMVQSTAGMGIEVWLPNIYDFASDENIVINNAVLELPVIDDADLELYEPNATVKAVMKVDGVEVNIPDAILSSSGIDYVGGVYDEEEKIYRVTVSRFIQQVLNGQIEEPIFTIYPSLSRTVANRTKIKVGSLDEDRRTKLIINYTTF